VAANKNEKETQFGMGHAVIGLGLKIYAHVLPLYDFKECKDKGFSFRFAFPFATEFV
jgi:hypothetical protein